MDTSIARQTDGKLIRAQKGINKTLPFFCPGCKQEVYAATEGGIQRPHFRHKSSTANNLKGCGEPENYIHWITKELFADFYRSANKFYIEVPTTLYCAETRTCTKRYTHKINLKEKYPHILVEQYDQGFRPDCMLYNDTGENLYFEVKYTHAVSQEKIDTGVPIIELHVSTEKDIDRIIEEGRMKLDNSEYKIYNKSILLPQALTFDCRGKCLRALKAKQQLTESFQKEKAVQHSSPESSYWGGIYKGWAKWKNELPKTYKSKSISKLQQDKEDGQNQSKSEDKTTVKSKQMSFDFGD